MAKAAWIAIGLAAAAAGSARAADQPLYQPAPNWVRPVAIPFDMKPSGAAADLLLWSVQDRLAPGVSEDFVERAFRINAPEGLSQTGNLIGLWDPSTETLAIHRARIIRDGKTVDLLAGGKTFTVLRRETNLEAAAIDGELTATLQPEGLRVGDVVDLAMTITRREPALAGHIELQTALGHPGAVGRLVERALWPAGQPVRVSKTDDLPPLAPVTRDGWTEIGFEQTDAVSPDPPNGAGNIDRMFGEITLGDFASWNALSAAVWPLYAKAEALAPDSPLKTEIARLRAANPDPKARALAALEWVESQTRYLYVGLNAGGYTPAPADLTWSRRFGDCKGKTVLLLALLKGLGVEAEPALVNTGFGDGLNRLLPQMGDFDHVLVRAAIAGEVYWLDGTRIGDENLDILPVPNFHWALPLRVEGAGLEALVPKVPIIPVGEIILKVDARKGMDKPALVQETVVARGDAALILSLAVKRASRADSDRILRQGLTAERDWIKPANVDFNYDAQKMEARATLVGSGVPPFTTQEGSNRPREWLIEGSSVGSNADFTRTSAYHRDAPFVVDYPDFERTMVEVDLPDGGKGFAVNNAQSVSRTAAGVTYSRSAGISGDRFTMVASKVAVAPSFPARDAAAAEAVLHNLAEYDVVLISRPTAVTTPTPSRAALEPSAEPDDPAYRGAAAFRAKDYPAAEAAFTTALGAAPTAKLYYNRAVARAAMGKDDLATSDLEAALKLEPKDARALFALGKIALARGDVAAAAPRFAAAEAAAEPSWPMSLQIGVAYQSAGRFADSIPFLDRTLAAIPSLGARAVVLNERCWARAVSGAELDRALADCDESLRLAPGAWATLDSRGYVELQSGANASAVADFTAALAKKPDLSSSLFGRGVAEGRLGEASKAAADLTASRALDPKIDAMAAGWGVRP